MSQHASRHPWEQFADSFEEVERAVHFVDPDSPLGRAMASAREVWALDGVPEPDDFHVTPNPVEPDE